MNEDRRKIFADMQGCKNFTSYVSFLRKWPEDVLHQNVGINQDMKDLKTRKQVL